MKKKLYFTLMLALVGISTNICALTTLDRILKSLDMPLTRAKMRHDVALSSTTIQRHLRIINPVDTSDNNILSDTIQALTHRVKKYFCKLPSYHEITRCVCHSCGAHKVLNIIKEEISPVSQKVNKQLGSKSIQDLLEEAKNKSEKYNLEHRTKNKIIRIAAELMNCSLANRFNLKNSCKTFFKVATGLTMTHFFAKTYNQKNSAREESLCLAQYIKDMINEYLKDQKIYDDDITNRAHIYIYFLLYRTKIATLDSATDLAFTNDFEQKHWKFILESLESYKQYTQDYFNKKYPKKGDDKGASLILFKHKK